MIKLGSLVDSKAFGKFEQGKVYSNPYAKAFAPQPTIKEAEDHEVSMANNSLDTIIKMATELKAKMGENEKDIPAWIQDHITNAENFISQASSNYHEYGVNESKVNEEEIKWNAVENAIINFLKANTKILDKRVKDRDTDGVKGGLKSIISGLTNAQRSLKLESVKGSKLNEMGPNDVHFKQVMSFYDKGSASAKKAVSIFVSGKTNASRNQIADDLGDMDYNEILDVVDHFKLDEKSKSLKK
jgi:hypothetical protein